MSGAGAQEQYLHPAAAARLHRSLRRRAAAGPPRAGRAYATTRSCWTRSARPPTPTSPCSVSYGSWRRRTPTDRQSLLDTLDQPPSRCATGCSGCSAPPRRSATIWPGTRGDWQALVTYEPRDLHPGVAEFERGLAEAADPVALRVAYRRCLLSIAARDVCGTTDVAETAAELADLATATLRAALAIARAAAPEDAALCRLAVIAMGKCGGHELNYVSDVDVIFVGEAGRRAPTRGKALQAATRLASHLMRICSETTVEGTIWPVDANLRPEGRNGPLVRTLSSHLAYYQRWAKTWEFQALLKARPVAGDLELGEEYVDAVAPLVWQAAERENFVADVQKMRRRVVENIPVAEVDRELKLGPGGLRDVEFAVQLLQLVHGRGDASLRSGTTLDALQALAAGGYVGPRGRRAARRRLPLPARHGAPHPALPAAPHPPGPRGRGRPAPPRPLARAAHRPGRRAEPGVEAARLRRAAAAREAVLPAAAGRRRPARARRDPAQRRRRRGERLEALGYADPAAALRHLEALAVRRDPQGRHPAHPAAGAARLVRRLRRPGRRAARLPQGLRRARQDPLVSAAAAGRGRRRREPRPRAVRRAARPRPAAARPRGGRPARRRRRRGLAPRGRARWSRRCWPPSAARTAPSRRRRGPRGAPPRAVPYGRRGHRSARTAPRSSPAEADQGALVDRVGDAVSDLNAATLAGTLRAAVRDGWGDTLPTRFAVIGMGRFGGHELGYGSDADVLFVHEPREGVDEQEAAEAANSGRLRDAPAAPAAHRRPAAAHRRRPAPRGQVRAAGAHADVVRGLLPALVAGVGEPGAAAGRAGRRATRSWAARFIELIDPLRYPAEGLGEDAVREIRRLKARMESERMPRGADPTLHTKLGPRRAVATSSGPSSCSRCGTAAAEPGLRTTRTREALAAARAAGLISAEDAQILDEAWVLATRVRNARDAGARPGRATPSPPTARELARGGAVPGVRARACRRHARRLPADHPAGPGCGGGAVLRGVEGFVAWLRARWGLVAQFPAPLRGASGPRPPARPPYR